MQTILPTKPHFTVLTTDYNLPVFEASLSFSELEALMDEDEFLGCLEDFGTDNDIFTDRYSRSALKFQERLKQSYSGMIIPRAELFGNTVVLAAGTCGADWGSLSYEQFVDILLLRSPELDRIKPFLEGVLEGVASIPLIINYTMNGSRHDDMLSRLDADFNVSHIAILQRDEARRLI